MLACRRSFIVGYAQLRILFALGLLSLAVTVAGIAITSDSSRANSPAAAPPTASVNKVANPILIAQRVLASYGIGGHSRMFYPRAAGGVGGANVQSTRNPLLLGGAVQAALSPALRDLPTQNPFSGWIEREAEPHNPVQKQQPANPSVDPVVQTTAPNAGMPAVGASFEGISIEQACGNCLPPDPNGAVGLTQYVQTVNSHLAVFDKTGKLLIDAPKPINGLWSGQQTSECYKHNDGDPIVLYDQMADRWVVSQFVASPATGENYAECVAVSQTGDATGAYYLYEFDESASTFHDYPKLGVWPDAYYMTTNQFPGNAPLATAAPGGAWAFERDKMLAGQAARYIFFDETDLVTPNTTAATYTPFGQLPSTLDGKNLPPAGLPNFFAEVDDMNDPDSPPANTVHDEMRLWKFHVDWTDPTKSTYGTGSSAPAAVAGFPGMFQGNAGQPDFILPIANYVPNQCQIENGPNDCVPQNGTSGQPPAYLDVLGDRLMFRLAYRNFGDHESLVVNHTVEAVSTQTPPSGSPRTGVRWYEVRGLSSTPTIFQQGTFAPLDPNNPLWRWMGSVAMDGNGNLAVGYSASGPAYFPSLHYAGRLASDPPGELTQGEAVMFTGEGVENNTGLFPFRNRWGDYSALTVDPADDQTFWYTNEYMVSTPTDILPVDWHTRIGSFKFAATSGSPTPTVTPTASPTASPSVTPTPTASATVTPSATVSPTVTPTTTPAQLLNISTRARVQSGDNVVIGGFIITGNGSKNVLLRALGPSLNVKGTPVPGRLDDPTLELRNKDSGALIASNDNWKDTQQGDIEATQLQPPDDRESAIAKRLNTGSYTAAIRGKNDGQGIGLVEVYDLDRIAAVQLANISTRGFVDTGDNVMIGGFIAGPSNRANLSVVIRAIGPSLAAASVPNTLQDPTLELHDENGALLAANDDWATDQNAAQVAASGLAPKDPRESALYRNLPRAAFTAIVAGKNGAVGNALVEIYKVAQ